MSREYNVHAIVGFLGKDLLNGYSEEDLYDLIERYDMSFIDPYGMGAYEDGVIGYEIESGYLFDMNIVHKTYENEINQARRDMKKNLIKMVLEPQLYCVVGSH